MHPIQPSFSQTYATRIAAGMGLLAVALGAFGAHGLKQWLHQLGTVDIWEKAAFYHFIHTVVMLVLAERKPFRSFAWWALGTGILFFSGSLYLLAVTGKTWLVAITPFGGTALLAGWAALLFPSRRSTAEK